MGWNISAYFKGTCYGLGENSKNMQVLDIQGCNQSTRLKEGLLAEYRPECPEAADFGLFWLTHSKYP